MPAKCLQNPHVLDLLKVVGAIVSERNEIYNSCVCLYSIRNASTRILSSVGHANDC